jgi:hypothetical protein
METVRLKDMNTLLEPRLIRAWAIVLIIVGMILQCSFIFVKREALAHRPFEEDTFFHMAVTRNMAMGRGITIDGVERTSGAQPGNFMYVLAHLAAHFDKWQALRWARLLDVITSVGSAVCLYWIVRRLLRRESVEKAAAYALLAAGLWLSSFQVFRTNLNGYETGLAAWILLACTGLYLKVWQDGGDKASGYFRDILLGVLFGLAVLTRVDHGFLAASAAVFFLGFGLEPFPKKLIRVAIWSAVAGLITTPWWIFNYQVGGAIMPISGKASAFQMTFHGYWPSVIHCFLRTAESILTIITLSFHSPYGWGENLPWIFFLIVLTMSLTIYFKRTRPLATLQFAPMDLRPLMFLLAFSLILIFYYVFAHGSWWFMKRYTHPIRAAAYIFSAFFVAGLSLAFKKQPGLRPAVVFSGILGAHVLLSIALTASTYNKTDSNQFMKVVSYLGEHCQDGRIGAYQSGTLGYFLDNVVNLDGKNNAHALQAVTTRKSLDYIQSQNLKYIADWPSIISSYCNYDEFLKYYEPIATVGAHEIYRLRNTTSTSVVPDPIADSEDSAHLKEEHTL